MPNILMPLDASVPTRDGSLLKHPEQAQPVRNHLHPTPTTAPQPTPLGVLSLDMAGASLPRSSAVKAEVRAREILPDSGHAEWIAQDCEQSLLASLIALNAHLLQYEPRRRAG